MLFRSQKRFVFEPSCQKIKIVKYSSKRKNHCNPLSNWRRPEASTKKTVLPATQNLLETSMQTQAQNMLASPCKQRAIMHVHAQGLFLPARTAAKLAFASSLLYAPVLVQLTSCIPACCSHSHQPNFFVK